MSPDIYLQTLDLLVGLIEERLEDRRGHSALVAGVCRQIAEGMGIAGSETQSILIAAHLHDLGLAKGAHVTAFDVAFDGSNRDSALETFLGPIDLLESVSLPQAVTEILRYRYERFDGKGIPDGLRGPDIPLGARLLAVGESYIDLTDNERNILGHRFDGDDACDVLAEHAGTAFDPVIVDWLCRVETGKATQTQVAAKGRHKERNAAGRLRTRGVSGSLQEMALPDVIQVLANGRKSGRLEVRSRGLHGELLFHQGSIHDARFGDVEGAEAVYGILRLTEGEFALEPGSTSTPVQDVIGIPTHHLLLEAMRRLDEDGLR
jgi:hypothetical protein